MPAIDGALLALTLGATFVARSFSGDKEQLVPIIQAGLAHRGFAFVDIISPCVTFNDHDGSTKSYACTREHKVEVVQADFVPPAEEISAHPRAPAEGRGGDRPAVPGQRRVAEVDGAVPLRSDHEGREGHEDRVRRHFVGQAQSGFTSSTDYG